MVIRKSIEEVFEFDGEVVLENVEIAGEKYKLKIVNMSGRLLFDFNDQDYKIVIGERDIGFERYVARPNHDHNDMESLQIGEGDNGVGVKKGELKWLTRFPDNRSGYRFFYVPFGKRQVDW